MKIALITLSGDSGIAHEQLLERWPEGRVIDLPRSMLEDGSAIARLRRMRRENADVFAVMTEGLGWQYGQEALMYFGALAGAAESVVLDARGDSVVASRSSLLASSPIRIANCFLRGRTSVRKADVRLADLERAVPTKAPQVPAGAIKIAYFRTTPSAGTVPGGATSHINGVTNGLKELGCTVEFVANDLIAGIDPSTSFHILSPLQNVMPRAAFDIANGLSFADRASEVVEAIAPAFIYERYSRFSMAGVEVSRRTGSPLFLEYNGSEVWVGKHWDSTAKLDLLERYEFANLRLATRIFVISEIEKNNLLERGIPDEKVIVNPNGVDTQKFRPGVGGVERRRDLGVDDREVLAGFLGSFGPWHGVLALADAIAMTPRSSGIRFLFVGNGSLRTEVEARLTATGDMDRVIFAGSVAHELVPSYLDACDILVSPHVPLADGSDFFGSPTKLFEYMAMGKGIVASRLGQIGDVLDDGVTALLVEPGNETDLSSGFQKLASEKQLRLGLGARREVGGHRPSYMETKCISSSGNLSRVELAFLQ